MSTQYGHNPFVPSAKQEVFNPDSLIAGNLQPVTKSGIISGGAYTRGTILGTADGIKYIICKKDATDGTQKPAAILADNIDASGGDIQGGLYLMGEYSINAVTFDATWTADEVTFACEAANIYLRNPVAAPEID